MSTDSVAPHGLVQDHGRGHFFTQRGMHAAKCNRCRDRWMPQQNLIDFVRSDVFASADDDVFDSSGQVQIAIGVQQSFVTGTKPSIHKSASVGFGIVLVSTKYIGALNGNFAALVGAEVIAVLVHDADAQAGAHADRTCLAMPRRQRIRGHLVGSFSHSVGFDEGHAKKILDLVNQLRRQGRAAGTDEAQSFCFYRFVMSPGQQKLMHRGYPRIPGHTMFSNRPPERKRVEFGRNNYGSPGQQSRHD